MSLPSSPKKPYGWWKLNRRPAEADDPPVEEVGQGEETGPEEEQEEPEEPSGQLIFCPSCKIGNILAPDGDPNEMDCVICKEPLVPSEAPTLHKSVLASLFEPILGVRERHRKRMGYRRIHSAFEIEMDPNRDLKGDRLREAMQDWLEEQNTSWDRAKRRRRYLWDDRPWFLFGMIGLGVAVVCAGVFRVVSLGEDRSAPAPSSLAPEDPRAILRKTLPEELAEAQPVARAFFNANVVTDLMPIIRDRARVEPMIFDYYRKRKFEPVDPKNFKVVDAVDFAGRKFLRLAVQLPSDATYGLTLEKLGNTYQVDWESFVGYSAIDWSEFKAAAPSGGDTVKLRAYASFTEQYLAPFEDREVYQSILLRSIDGESFVGYIKRLDKRCVELRAKAAEAGKNHYEVIVDVRYPKEKWTKNEVEIVEIVQTGWVEWDRQPAVDN